MLGSDVQPGHRFVEFKKEDIEQSVPERFEKQVAENPGRLAVKTSLYQLSYGDFNKLANQIARAIRQSSNDEPVALLLEHDAPAILSIFGVLKAGRIFVPLDPLLPLNRLDYMLEDSGAKLIVTDSRCSTLAQRLRGTSCTVINMDRFDASIGDENLGISIAPAAISCILYTSGTTGRPKGVVHTHRNELHNVMHHTNSLCLSADDRLTLLGSYSTGQGMQDLYCALLNGGTLYPWSLKADGLHGLAEWMIRERISVYHSAATVFRHFVRTLTEREQFPDLRILRVGSEQVSWKDVEYYRKYCSDSCTFVNALSSSETKTIRQYIINKETKVSGLVPVGYPVEDVEVCVVDSNGSELEPNLPGEIAVRSRYLSPGYWKTPDLTSAVYLTSSTRSDIRVFRTGEWGKMASDGCLEHLGRKDAQVKIRGYRVETYEIELAILQHTAVDEVLVLCRENVRNDKYLVAYILLNRPPAPTVSELRNFLRQRIPDYMIPSAFIFLECLPLTPNGKIDRNALPQPSTARPALDVPFVKPKGPVEEFLANLWAEILGVDEIGMEDNFFDVGGNSLLAMQVVARVNKAFEASIALKRFFASPTISSLSQNVCTLLSAEGHPEISAIKPVARDKSLPLSFSQERLWFLDQWEPGNPVYNICRVRRVHGRLDIQKMEESLNSIVERHEILRTTFPATDGQPKQAIAPILRLTIHVVDLRNSPVAGQMEESLYFAREEARHPFDLTMGPLLRISLLEFAEEEHVFIFTVHQIICDGWSVQVFFREFWMLYDSLLGQQTAQLPILSVQFADFAVWQREWIEGKIIESQLSYWTKRLGNNLPLLNLPTDRPRRKQQGFHGARHFLLVSELLTEKLKELSRREAVTPFMTLLAAFQTLLYRYTGQEDLVVGFPIANRNWVETASLIGFFVNTLVSRGDFTNTPNFRECLARVRDDCLGAYSHQDLPFEKLVKELQPQRELTRNPLFQVMFVFQVSEAAQEEFHGLKSLPLEVDIGTSKFDLMLSLTDSGKELAGYFEYSTDLFERSTIQRMVGHFESLLEGIVADSAQLVLSLPLLTAGERRQLLVEWNETKVDYPMSFCIHELFEAQVERTPDAIAIEFEGKRLTYRELNARANQLAHHLKKLGIGPEKLVGVWLERSLEMIIGLLGILKAGGAYVPLDLNCPNERSTFVLEDAQGCFILTRETFPREITHCRVICLGREWDEITKQSNQNPTREVTVKNLAYVICTSGSTGQPKGVAIEHHSAVNLLYWAKQVFAPEELAGVLASTSICFDLSVFELFVPLSWGGKILLAENALCLHDLSMKNDITLVNTVPSVMTELLLMGNLPDSIWTVTLAGEPLRSELVRQIYEDGKVKKVYDLYGPSESTTYSTFTCRTTDGPATIGRPIANTLIYVLDSNCQPVPIGVPGELYIGGDGLARGYLNRPELTAEKFVANPFRNGPGGRLYRTGDLARYMPDGNIEFLGRVDNQTKIRGYRIELGEIESVLSQHPAVREALVVAHDDRTQREYGSESPKSDKHLVAYFVPTAGQPSISALRDFLKGKLPEFMIPSFFIPIEAVPLTPNGKIDRNALPLLDGIRPKLSRCFIEPRTAIEELVAQVWREVLELDKIGIYDNFFEVGGHSLSAARVVSRLRNAFQVELSLPRIFETPTVEGLARTVETSLESHPKLQIAPILAVPRDRPISPSVLQEPLLTLDRLFPGMPQLNIPVAWRLRGPLDALALERSVNEVIKRHEALRTVFPVAGGQQIQLIVPSLLTKLEVIDLQQEPEREREAKCRALAREEGRIPFDLERGPLFRVKLVRLSEYDHTLLVTLHHVIGDGWSMILFLRDLAALYDCCLRGTPSPLPELPIQYADFAYWQRYALENHMETQRAYWKQQLSGPLLSMDVPAGRPPFDELILFTARRTISISGALFEGLRRRSQQENSTVFMILVTALNILLYHITGQEDIRIGTLVANRNRSETENIIGHFVNTVILRTRLSADSNVHDLVKRVRDVILAAHAHQDLPFETLLRSFESDGNLPSSSICRVLFIYQSSPFYTFKLPRLEVTILDENQASEAPEIMLTAFDLIFLLKERHDALVGTFLYKIEVLDEAASDRIVGDFQKIVSRITHNPDLTVRELVAWG